MQDLGWFPADSVTRKVWSYPTAVSVGFSRAVVVEELDPFLIAPVKVSSKIYSQTSVRYDRTVRYFATQMFADSRSITKASEVLMRVHHRAAAPDPVSGLLSDPNNPDEQLWIHMTAWHSILYTYEVYGPGRLSPADEAQYWADCAIAARAQTIDPASVPRSRDEVRDYFARMRPRLAASEATQEAMDHLTRADALYPQLPLPLKSAPRSSPGSCAGRSSRPCPSTSRTSRASASRRWSASRCGPSCARCSPWGTARRR